MKQKGNPAAGRRSKGRQPAVDPESLPYRAGVGIMLLNRQDEVFVAQRLDMRNAAWQMPQGGIDPGENAETAAYRELFEEVGVRNAKIIAESADWHSYDLPAHLVPRLWGGRYRGQRQKWFAMRFLGDDSEIRIDGEHAEFSAWRWAGLAELPAIIVPFKRPLYTLLVEEFRPLLHAVSEAPGRR